MEVFLMENNIIIIKNSARQVQREIFHTPILQGTALELSPLYTEMYNTVMEQQFCQNSDYD